ncbi:MAG: hypothetical protein V4534_09085 [Myxococcota bacterium]
MDKLPAEVRPPRHENDRSLPAPAGHPDNLSNQDRFESPAIALPAISAPKAPQPVIRQGGVYQLLNAYHTPEATADEQQAYNLLKEPTKIEDLQAAAALLVDANKIRRQAEGSGDDVRFKLNRHLLILTYKALGDRRAEAHVSKSHEDFTDYPDLHTAQLEELKPKSVAIPSQRSLPRSELFRSLHKSADAPTTAEKQAYELFMNPSRKNFEQAIEILTAQNMARERGSPTVHLRAAANLHLMALMHMQMNEGQKSNECVTQLALLTEEHAAWAYDELNLVTVGRI